MQVLKDKAAHLNLSNFGQHWPHLVFTFLTRHPQCTAFMMNMLSYHGPFICNLWMKPLREFLGTLPALMWELFNLEYLLQTKVSECLDVHQAGWLCHKHKTNNFVDFVNIRYRATDNIFRVMLCSAALIYSRFTALAWCCPLPVKRHLIANLSFWLG